MPSHWKSHEPLWAVRFNDDSELDGRLVGVYYDWGYKCPRVQGLTTILFRTRAEARAWIKERFTMDRGGMPVPVKVEVNFTAA